MKRLLFCALALSAEIGHAAEPQAFLKNKDIGQLHHAAPAVCALFFQGGVEHIDIDDTPLHPRFVQRF